MIDVVIDLSHHNDVTDWAAIRAAGILGVIHKATQGTSFVDPMYTARKQPAKDAGLLWGAYHFGECGDATAQAQHFLDTIDPEPSDLLMLDFEPCHDTMLLDEAVIFIHEVLVQTGRWGGLYSGQSFLTDCMQGITATTLRACWLCIARYGTTMPEVPAIWPTWTMWQYTDSGTVPGIAGPCDRDRFNGTIDGLLRLWGVSESTPLGG